jgi:hypothetical protein
VGSLTAIVLGAAGGGGFPQSIADWLNALGMSEYAARFAENDVDTSVLLHLTDQDLKELGVSLGHRRKMLAAIAELGSAPVAPSAPPPITRAPVPATATPPPRRRHAAATPPPTSAAPKPRPSGVI